jgi:hypothetical protein
MVLGQAMFCFSNLPLQKEQITNCVNPLATGTKEGSHKHGTRFSLQKNTRFTPLKWNLAEPFESMSDSTLDDPGNGATNDHHQC